MANTVGTMAPPTNPCTIRNATMDWMSHDAPHRALETVNRAADRVKSQRVDSAWARKAEKGIITSSAIR